MILVTVRAQAHFTGDLTRMMLSDDVWTYHEPVTKVCVRMGGTLVQEPAMALGTGSVHRDSGLGISSQHRTPPTPGLDMALIAIQAFMSRSETPGKEERFYPLPLVSD